MKFEYLIGGKKFTQSMLVLDQIQQLAELLRGSGLIDADPTRVFNYLMEKNLLADAAAILLKPKGMSLEEKDVKSLAKLLKFEMDLETATKIARNFFSVNAVGAVMEKLAEAKEEFYETTGRA